MKKALMMTLAVTLAGGSLAAQAYEQGDWLVRFGATMVDPDTESDNIKLPGDLVAKAEVDDDTQFGFMPMYMVTDKWGVELLAATPFEHNIEAKGQGAIKGTTLDAGSTKHLPPTVSVLYHFRGNQKGWQPYIGVGVNYTTFFDEDTDKQLVGLLGSLTEGVVDDANLNLDDSFGLAARAGVDIPFADHWALNLAVWYIDIDTTAEVTPVANGTKLDKVKFDVEIDPWVYNVGIAYRF